MGLLKTTRCRILAASLLLPLLILESQCATIKEILNLNTPEASRTPRETQYYGSRYGGLSTTGQTVSSRPIKPEDAPEARERDGTNVEKRCIRCEYYNSRDYRYPYENRGRYDERYDDRNYRDRYDDRYRDRYYDDYDRKYYESGDRRYYDTDRRYYDSDRRYDDRDRYDRDRYDRRPEYYDRYDRDRYDDRYKNYDRYDNRGYRPWDETYRGSSGFDSSGRGYYFAVGRPEYSQYGSGYASNWNYGGGGGGGSGGGGRGSYDRDRSWREQGFSSSYRPRDPYDPGYNRGTSYLYGRPSSTTTTQSPSPSVGGNTVTDNPQTQGNTSSG